MKYLMTSNISLADAACTGREISKKVGNYLEQALKIVRMLLFVN